MIFKPIKALFNGLLKLLVTTIIFTTIYLATTGNLGKTTDALSSLNPTKILEFFQEKDLVSSFFKTLKEKNIIQVVDSNTNINNKTADKIPDNATNTTNATSNSANSTTQSATPEQNQKIFYAYYPKKDALITISKQTSIKDASLDIFSLPDYTPVRLNLNVNNPVTLHCKVLSSINAKKLGYMYKPSITPYECLIFVYKKPSTQAFYMKNVKFPLDIIFLDKDLKILSVVNNAPACNKEECPLYFAPKAYQVVIEMKGGNWKQFIKQD